MISEPFSVLLNGALMVHIFWVLSGFVLALPLLKRTSHDLIVRAAVKRYFRLMPLVFVTVTASFLLHQAGGYFVADFNMLSGFASGNFITPDKEVQLGCAIWDALFFGEGFNRPLWTIKLEFIGSLSLFGLVACTMALGRRTLVWVLFLAALLFVWPTDFMADFVVGLLLADFVLKRPDFRLGSGSAILLLIAVVLIGSYFMPQVVPGWWKALGTPFESLPLVSAAGLAVSVVLFSEMFKTALRNRTLVWLGERSFAIYAVHVLTLHSVGQGVAVLCMRMGLAPVASSVVGLLVFVPVTFYVSNLLTKMIDWPSISFANRAGEWFQLSRNKLKTSEVARMEHLSRT